MARSRANRTAEPTDGLAEALQSLVAQVECLGAQVDALSQRIQVLTQAVDDVREELGQVLDRQSRPHAARPITHITSMPKDPLASDFGERINQYSALPPEIQHPADTSPQSIGDAGSTVLQRRLFN